MTRIPLLLFVFVAALSLCACKTKPAKHFRNVSGPTLKLDYSRSNDIVVATDSLPEDLRVMTVTISDDDKINAAMDRLLVRLRGTDRNKPEQLPGDLALAEGGMLQASGRTRKINYTTDLEGTWESISIGLTSLQFITMADETRGTQFSRLIHIDTPDGRKEVRITADRLTGGLSGTTQYHGLLLLRLSAMLENGAYAEERLTALATIRIPDDYPAGFHAVNYPNGFRKP